jgi:diaminopimelate epimerase
MDRLSFAKYEGAGNDFLLVEAETEDRVSPDQARRLCDRHYGVGGDGVLLVLPATSEPARARMVVLNADGSRPEMCGNGLRCVALLLAERDGLERAEYVLDTDAGPRLARVERNGRAGGSETGSVTLGMGEGRLSAPLDWPFRARKLEFFRVDMGNPHAVCFVEGLTEHELDELGPAISAATPGGANVEVVSVRPAGGFSVLVWERGVGRTLACGTGAAAVAVAAAASGRAAFDQPMSVALPGGELELTVSQGTLDVSLKGPARRVFSGQVNA